MRGVKNSTRPNKGRTPTAMIVHPTLYTLQEGNREPGEDVGRAHPAAPAVLDDRSTLAGKRLPITARRLIGHRDARVAPDLADRRAPVGRQQRDQPRHGDDRLALAEPARERADVRAGLTV